MSATLNDTNLMLVTNQSHYSYNMGNADANLAVTNVTNGCRDSFYCRCAPINVQDISKQPSSLIQQTGFYEFYDNMLKKVANTMATNPFSELNRHLQKTCHTLQDANKALLQATMHTQVLDTAQFVYSLKALSGLVVKPSIEEHKAIACCGGQPINRLSCVLQRVKDLHAHYYTDNQSDNHNLATPHLLSSATPTEHGLSTQNSTKGLSTQNLSNSSVNHALASQSESQLASGHSLANRQSNNKKLTNKVSGIAAAVGLKTEVKDVDATKHTFIPPSPVFLFMQRYSRLAEYTNQLLYWDSSLCIHLNRYSYRESVAVFFKTVSRLGDGWFWYAMLAISAIMGGLSNWHFIAATIMTSLLGVVLYKVLKVKTVRPRPYQVHQVINLGERPLDVFSFPSGHTLHAVLFTLAMGGMFPVLLWVMVPFAILVGLSRMVLGLHYPTDVLIGAMLGIALSFLVPELTGLLRVYF